MYRRAITAAAIGLLLSSASMLSATADEGTIDAATIHPPIMEPHVSLEHGEGTFEHKGDALGRDFFVVGEPTGERPFPHMFRDDGQENADWYGWRAKVHAPLDGTVIQLRVNDETNAVGEPGDPPASSITFQRDDGVHVMYAHVREIAVKEGDHVKAGELVARVGNNGVGYMPHIHVGAWQDEEPMQIQIDLTRLPNWYEE